MANPICVKCGQKIKRQQAMVEEIDKVLGKVKRHLVCPDYCYKCLHKLDLRVCGTSAANA